MARTSGKGNKSIYQTIREELGYSREKASEMLQGIAPERIERIENGKFSAHPDEVMLMADTYKAPHLCNYYCANECAIGQQYVPEVRVKDLSAIVLEMLASLNGIRKMQERLIEITADGAVDETELEDFIDIQEELEKISITVETLQLWSERMLATGGIDQAAYDAAKARRTRK